MQNETAMTKLKFIYAQVNIYAINLHLIAFWMAREKQPQNIGRKSNQNLKTCHKMPSKCQLQAKKPKMPNAHYQYQYQYQMRDLQIDANNLCDVSKSNQIMRQKCRKSVKCFASGQR